MIAHFPDPYPGELLYSVLARCKTLLCEAELNGFCFRLFGDEHARAKIDLPDRLGYMAQRIPSRYLRKPETIADDMTLLRYYAPFLGRQRYLEVRDAMIQPKALKRVIPSLGPLKLGRTDCLRFCRECWKQDKASKSGDRYWRCSHQAPGCYVCSVHGTVLSRSPVKWSFRESWQAFIDANTVDLRNCATEHIPGQDRTVYQRLAQDVDWLLTGSVSDIHVEDLTRSTGEPWPNGTWSAVPTSMSPRLRKSLSMQSATVPCAT